MQNKPVAGYIKNMVLGSMRITKLRQPLFLVVDAFFIAMALFVSFLLRFGMDIPPEYMQVLITILPLAILTKLPVFYIAGFYNQLWEYASLKEMLRIFRGISSASLFFLVVLFFTRKVDLPRAVFIIDWFLSMSLVGGSYFMIRIRKDLMPNISSAIGGKPGTRAVVVGAGDVGTALVKRMIHDPSAGYVPVAMLDDDPSKIGLMIHGVEVVSNTKAIPDVAARYHAEEVIMAMPSAPPRDKRRIALSCHFARIACKTVPDLTEMVRGEEDMMLIRDVSPKELLGRKEVEIDSKDTIDCYSGRTVLITGAAGSIGSEICRQVIELNPARVIATDIYENGLYHIDEEIRGVLKEDSDMFEIRILDVRDESAIERAFTQFKPDIIFHAAAYKHVPMMEAHPLEAMANNFLGTERMIRAAKRFKCQRFISISTDKAVNPTNVMGLSKKFGEKSIIMASTDPGSTKFMAVRFGNVLGSNGSVIPKFKKQIKNGEPITVTHQAITRYFMTIQEAVILVTQAAAIGRGGEIFVLDMGDPVRIMDLARSMVRLAGLEPDEDVRIEVTGLRPGEKMNEELFNTDEEVQSTKHPQINQAISNVDKRRLKQLLRSLERTVTSADESKLNDVIHDWLVLPEEVAN